MGLISRYTTRSLAIIQLRSYLGADRRIAKSGLGGGTCLGSELHVKQVRIEYQRHSSLTRS